MTQICFIRHGQTDWNVERRCQGHADIPLNATGLAQVVAALSRLPGRKWAAIYSSDLQRCAQTAQVLAAGLRLPVHLDARLREIDQGDWEGCLVSDLQRLYPQARLENYHPDRPRVNGAESVAQVSARALQALEDISHRHPQEGVIVVSHGVTIATLLCHARGIPLLQAYHLIPENAEPLLITWNGQRSN